MKAAGPQETYAERWLINTNVRVNSALKKWEQIRKIEEHRRNSLGKG